MAISFYAKENDAEQIKRNVYEKNHLKIHITIILHAGMTTSTSISLTGQRCMTTRTPRKEQLLADLTRMRCPCSLGLDFSVVFSRVLRQAICLSISECNIFTIFFPTR